MLGNFAIVCFRSVRKMRNFFFLYYLIFLCCLHCRLCGGELAGQAAWHSVCARVGHANPLARLRVLAVAVERHVYIGRFAFNSLRGDAVCLFLLLLLLLLSACLCLALFIYLFSTRLFHLLIDTILFHTNRGVCWNLCLRWQRALVSRKLWMLFVLLLLCRLVNKDNNNNNYNKNSSNTAIFLF